jgi:DNA-binding MarR family transcriptional regulator
MQRLRARLYGFELELGQADALEVLAQQGPCRMRELADALRVDASTATRAVQRLEEAGLARRKSDSADARCVLVAATDKGQRLRDRVTARGRAALRDILEEFDPAERAQLAELLDRFVRAIDDYASTA